MSPRLTTVVNIHVADYDVYVGRAGRGEDGYLGNPCRIIGGDGIDERLRRAQSLHKFVAYFKQRIMADAVFRDRVSALAGQRLGCHCAPAPCHAEVYAAWVNDGWAGVARFEERLQRWTMAA